MAALPLPPCPRRFYRPNPPHAVTISNIPQKRGLTKPIAPSSRELSAKLTEGVFLSNKKRPPHHWDEAHCFAVPPGLALSRPAQSPYRGATAAFLAPRLMGFGALKRASCPTSQQMAVTLLKETCVPLSPLSPDIAPYYKQKVRRCQALFRPSSRFTRRAFCSACRRPAPRPAPRPEW